MNPASRIALGTAQFGLDYGVTNRTGQPSEDTARAVIECARGLGIAWLDTAAAYGSAESVVGRLVGTDPAFRICTKVLAGNAGANAPEVAQAQFDASLARLARDRVDVLMIHDPRHLLGDGGEQVYCWLAAQRERGRTGAIGASVYDGATARALAAHYRLDWIQLPLNVLDQRCVLDGTLSALGDAGVRVQARSALLQGLLLADPSRLPPALAAAAAPLAKLNARAAADGIPVLQLALGFVASRPEVELIVLGVESPQQLVDCALALRSGVNDGVDSLASDDPSVIDPRCWPPGLRLAA
jgi:aryl-alcohol dehydrogenase-like predicted oxidoreductase